MTVLSQQKILSHSSRHFRLPFCTSRYCHRWLFGLWTLASELSLSSSFLSHFHPIFHFFNMFEIRWRGGGIPHFAIFISRRYDDIATSLLVSWDSNQMMSGVILKIGHTLSRIRRKGRKREKLSRWPSLLIMSPLVSLLPLHHSMASSLPFRALQNTTSSVWCMCPLIARRWLLLHSETIEMAPPALIYGG